MFNEKPPYDPVTAPVPGVNQKMRAEELKSALSLGDPSSSKSPIVPQEKKVIFKIPGVLKVSV